MWVHVHGTFELCRCVLKLDWWSCREEIWNSLTMKSRLTSKWAFKTEERDCWGGQMNSYLQNYFPLWRNRLWDLSLRQESNHLSIKLRKISGLSREQRDASATGGRWTFQSPKTLARYLRFLEGDERLYNHYLRWDIAHNENDNSGWITL